MSVRGPLLKLALFTVVALAVTSLLFSTLQQTVRGETRTYVAEFSDVSGLRPGDDVRMAGVRVGRVDDLELSGARAEVTVSVQADQPVFESTRAVLRYQNLVGQRFLAFVPGRGATRPLADGARIPIDRTEPAFDLTVLLNGFQPLFSVLEPAEINRLSETIVAVLQGAGPQLRPLLAQTAELTSKIADRDQVIGSVLVNLTAVLDQIAGKGDRFDTLIDQTRRLVTGLSAQSGALFGALRPIDRFARTAGRFVTDVRPDLEADLRRFDQVAGLFLREEPVVEQTVRGFPGFLGGLARPAQFGSWVNIYACTVDLAVPGLPPGALVALAGEQQSEVCR